MGKPSDTELKDTIRRYVAMIVEAKKKLVEAASLPTMQSEATIQLLAKKIDRLEHTVAALHYSLTGEWGKYLSTEEIRGKLIELIG